MKQNKNNKKAATTKVAATKKVVKAVALATPPVASAEEIKDEAPAKIDVLEKHLNVLYDFRFNKVKGQLEYKLKAKHKYQLLTDYLLNSLFREILKAKINTTPSLLRGLLHSDFSIEYNPFDEYFNALPAWDGFTDHIAALAATVKTNNDPLWNTCFKKWIVAMVGCVLEPATTNHTVIVFSGKQGLGKTTWSLNLIPKQLADYCFSGTINPDNKDTLIQLSECILINLDELESLNKTAIGSLKELITKKDIRIRRPYGYHNENLPRRASFVGSVNNKEFLNDTTGSRRFLCFEVTHIDYQTVVDLSKVYAQALHLFRNGFKHYFDKEEIIEIMANNEQYSLLSIEEELLITYYDPIENADAKLFLSTTEIATELAKKSSFSINNTSKQQLGKALNKHKFVRVKRKDRYVYALKEKDAEKAGYEAKYSMKGDKKV